MLFPILLPIFIRCARAETTYARGEKRMQKIHYKLVQHDGGWAYKLDDVFSEAFPTHQAALKAARRVAAEQHVPGDTRYIEYQTADGVWHTELAVGIDRPEADVSD